MRRRVSLGCTAPRSPPANTPAGSTGCSGAWSTPAARRTRTLALLTASAVPLLEALQIGAQVMPNLPMRAAIKRAALKVREGGSFSRALGESGYFPPVALRLIASGERAGALEHMLE